MAHFAQLDDNNVVLRVIVVANEELLDENGSEVEQKGIDFCKGLFGGKWIQTSFNKSFRANFAGVGCVYDPIRDVFHTQKLQPSWVLNETTFNYEPPVPKPENTNEFFWTWDEDKVEWVKNLL